MMRLRISIACVFASMLAAGCAHYEGLATKAVPVDAASLAASKALAEVKPSASWPATSWWQRFGDAQLDALMAEALAGNPSIANARTRVERAQAWGLHRHVG